MTQINRISYDKTTNQVVLYTATDTDGKISYEFEETISPEDFGEILQGEDGSIEYLNGNITFEGEGEYDYRLRHTVYPACTYTVAEYIESGLCNEDLAPRIIDAFQSEKAKRLLAAVTKSVAGMAVAA